MDFPTKMYLGGTLVDGQGVIEVTNPATEDHAASVAAAGLDDVQQALEVARGAFPAWSKTSIAARQAWMRKLRDEVIANEDYLRTCIHYEMGKPWAQTQEDFDSLKNSLAFYAEEIARFHDFGLADRAGTHSHRMVYEAAGVAVAFLAWNFPLLNLAFKIGPAMAATRSAASFRASGSSFIVSARTPSFGGQSMAPSSRWAVSIRNGRSASDRAIRRSRSSKRSSAQCRSSMTRISGC